MNVKEKNFNEKQIFDLQPLNGQGQRPPNFDMMRLDIGMDKTNIAISHTVWNIYQFNSPKMH